MFLWSSTESHHSYSYSAFTLSRSAHPCYSIVNAVAPGRLGPLDPRYLRLSPRHPIPSQLLLVGMKCYASGTPRRTVYILYLNYRPWSPRPCPPSNRRAYIRPAEHVSPQLAILHFYYFAFFISFLSCFLTFFFFLCSSRLLSYPRLRTWGQI